MEETSPFKRKQALRHQEEREHLFKHFAEAIRRDWDILDSRLRNKAVTNAEYAMALRCHYVYFHGVSERYRAALAKEIDEMLSPDLEQDYE
jgi:hypothetical protein